MKYLTVCFLVYLMTACSSKHGGQDFYTWVDESGNLRTERRASNQNTVKAHEKSIIDQAQYISSEELEKRLNNTRLYAWQDAQGNQVIQEEPKGKDIDRVSTSVHYVTQEQGLLDFREGRQHLLSEIKNTEIILQDFYHFNKKSEADYILIEIDLPVDQLRIKSFVRNNQVAIPDIIPLSGAYDQRFEFDRLWGQYIGETWRSYGYLYEDLTLPRGVQYILVKPSKALIPLKVNQKSVKITDFGSITIELL